MVQAHLELSTAVQVTLEDFRAAQTRVRPSAMREVALELPRVAWGDVGGLDAIKQRLKEAVEWPQKRPELLQRLGAKASPALAYHYMSIMSPVASGLGMISALPSLRPHRSGLLSCIKSDTVCI